MAIPNYPSNWYWIVGDTNPTTQVFESATGTFIANNNATYQTWVGAFGAPSPSVVAVTGAANNGAGLIRLTVDSTSNYATGNVRVVQNVLGTTEANGTWTLTVIDQTHVDLQGSAFVNPYTSGGVLGGGTFIDTAADLYLVMDSYNQSLVPQGYLAVSSAVNVQIANTPPAVYDFTATAGGLHLLLGQANLFGSIALGRSLVIHNASTTAFAIRLQDNVTILFGSVRQGEYVTLFLSDNSTANGTWFGRRTPAYPLLPLYGGTGITSAPADGGILVGQSVGVYSQVTASGDVASISTAGAFTLASVIAAGGPTGDATHVPQITYDAKGRLTTVTSVAITGTPPGGAAGGDLSGTYPNPTVTGINGTPVSTSITSPLIIGGSAAGSSLTLESTSGVGTTDAIILKTGSQSERVRILTGGNVGIGTNTPQSLLHANKNTTQDVASVTGSAQQITGADGALSVLQLDSFGAANVAYGGVLFNSAAGTGATPTQTQSGAALGFIGGRGYTNSTAYTGIQCQFQFAAAEAQTSSAQGQRIDVYTTPTGSTTTALAARFHASGGFAVGAAAADPGANIINVTTGYRIANAAASGNYLRGNGTNFVSAALAAADMTGTVAVANGGTGAATFTTHGILLGEGTSAVVPTAAMTNGQLLVGQTSADPLPKTVAGDATMAASGSITVTGINGVDQTTAYTSYTPTITASTGTFTTVSATGKSKQIGKTVHVQVVVTLTTIGTAAGRMIVTLPVNPVNATSANVFGYTDVGGAGAFRACCGGVFDSGTKMSVARYDGTFPGTSGDMIYLNFVYEAA